MIKQYDFPNIFQNVVGQVVPIRKKKMVKYNPSLGLVCALYQELKSIDCLKGPKQANGKLQIQSKKKKLVRRIDFSKTSAWFAGKNLHQQSDKFTDSEDKATFSNFLKRKKNGITLNKKQSISSDRLNDSYFQPQNLASFDNPPKGKNRIKRIGVRTNNLRIRTSLNQSQRIWQHSRDQRQGRSIQQQIKNLDFHEENDEIKEDYSTAMKKRRQKQKHKTFFKNDSPEKGNSHQEPQQIRKGERKKTKKKSVNFNINSQKENNQIYRRKNSRNATKVIKNFGQKSLRLHYNKQQSQFGQCENKSESQWTAKSVVSIKLSSNARIKSKKSLRSQQSILLDSSDHFLYKKTTYKRYGTKKLITTTKNNKISLKKVKSMMSLSNVSTKQKPTKNVANKKMTQVKIQKSEKVIKDSTKRTKNKISILVKSRDPYLSQSTKSIDPVRSSNFHDLVFQRSRKNLMKSMRTQGNDVFTELNNFHRFLQENDIDDNQLQIPKVMTKPMIIESSMNHKEVLDRQIFNNQCTMIDMGLILIKKMSFLKQKRI